MHTHTHTRSSTVSYLFRQQTVHDEDQRSLQAVEDSEDIHHRDGALFKHEGPEHPHQTEYTHLGDSCHCESSADGIGVEGGGESEERATDRE